MRKKHTQGKRKSSPAGGTRRKSAAGPRGKRTPAKPTDRRTAKRKSGLGRGSTSKRKSDGPRSSNRTTGKTDLAVKPGSTRVGSHESAAASSLTGNKPVHSESSADFPKELQRLRQSLGLKQTHLAALLNVDSMTISRWERRALSPRPWHRELLAVFKRAADARFSWGRTRGYRYNRFDVAFDTEFELPKIPDRLREILVAAHDAAKAKDEEKA